MLLKRIGTDYREAFNRTIVELKYRHASALHPRRGPFNRTIVELK